MPKTTKNKVIDSMIWASVDKVGCYFLLFVSNLILVRLLSPDDFGYVAMLFVFLDITGIIVNGGFITALIQKKNPSSKDFSTVFYINTTVSVALYWLLFFLAPAIADFYSLPLLCSMLRVQALALIINSFSVVQLAVLRRELRFKSLAIRNILSSIIGIAVCIPCAICGLGVWSLVINILVQRFSGALLLWWTSKWRPQREFSWASAKELFGFGGFMMLSSLIASIYGNLQSLLVGKFFSATALGYVNQAKKLEEVPSGALSTVVTQVSFPVFSKLQDDLSTLRYGFQKNIKSIQYINLPMVFLLMVIAEPLILLLYGEKWAECIPYFQILCFSRLLGVLVPLNMSIIGAMGKGKLYFLTQFFKCVFSIAVIALSVHHGIYALLIALALIPYFDFFVCSLINQKLIGYGFFRQLGDTLPTMGVALFSALLVSCLKFVIPCHPFIVMGLQVVVYMVLFTGFTKLFKFESYTLYRDVIKRKLKCSK